MKQDFDPPRRRPLTALSTQKPINAGDISTYHTERELIKIKHKPEVMFEDLKNNKENPISRIIQQGPSLLGTKCQTNTRPLSSKSSTRFQPSQRIDSNKISKLNRRLHLVKSQTKWIERMLDNDPVQQILRMIRSKDQFTRERKCTTPPKPSVYKPLRRSCIDPHKSPLCQSQTQISHRLSQPQLMVVRSFFIS